MNTKGASNRAVRRRLIAAVAVAGLIATLAAPAHAAITEEQRYTTGTAHTLNANEVMISLATVGFGVADRLQLDTVFLADLIGVLNILGKARLYEGDTLTFSLGTGFLYFNTDYTLLKFLLPKDFDVSVMGVPVSGLMSIRLSPGQYLHLSAEYTFALARAGGTAGTITAGGFFGATGQVMYEIDVRQGSAVIVGAGATYLDGVVPVAFASYVFGWETFHLELGGGVGPSMKVKQDAAGNLTASSAPGFVPRLNLWWRF